jgi:DegV family protein with EDD domain
MKIGIVTDSTADINPDFFALRENVVMVPLTVHFGTEVYKDWTEMPPDRFFPKMVESVAAQILPKTSQPPAGDFAAVYKDLAKTCDHIISIHISSKLSGTMQSAKSAVGMLKDPAITLVDSEVASVLLGAIVIRLVEKRDAGASLEELIRFTNEAKEWGKIFFSVETLKYLEKGGRIGKAQAMLGSLLNVKPILTLEDGVVAPKSKASGVTKAMKEIARLLKEEIARRPAGMETRISIGSAYSPATLAKLETALREEGIDLPVQKTEIGSVIGVYVGPGAFFAAIL